MFVRFRKTGKSLQATVVETHRVDGKVRHEHVATLGSIRWPAETSDRITFWKKLHERLAKLGNRLTDQQRATVLSAIHARIPMTGADDQRTVQLENAKADASFWDGMVEMHNETIEGHKRLLEAATKAIAEGEAEKKKAADNAARAKDRAERIERGEDVPGGLHRPRTREDLEKALVDAGMTREDLRHCEVVHAISTYGEEAWKAFMEQIHMRREKEAKRTARDMLRALEVLGQSPD
jgi:hypothetical protein